MKKILFALLIIVTLLSLVSCGDSKAVLSARELISSIEISNLMHQEEVIIAAEKAVANLSEKDRDRLENLDVLTYARETFEQMKSNVERVEELINDIGKEEVTLGKEEQVAAARKLYDSQDTIIKESINNYEMLEEAEATLQKKRAAVGEIEEAIGKIGTVELDSKEKVASIRKLFDSQDADVKANVSNISIQVAAEENLADLMAEHVEALINAIGTVTLDKEDSIVAAENELQQLKKLSNRRISNEQVLTDARNQLEDIKMEAKKQADIDHARSIIRVHRIWCSRPDSVGGVEVYFNFTNNSEKVIKYITFGYAFYNAVGDKVNGKYDSGYINYGADTGPYAKGEGLRGSYWYWGKHYNWDIKTVELVSLSIEYMDGTETRLTSDQLDYVQY